MLNMSCILQFGSVVKGYRYKMKYGKILSFLNNLRNTYLTQYMNIKYRNEVERKHITIYCDYGKERCKGYFNFA